MMNSEKDKVNEKESAQRERTFNGMTAREWTINSRSVWNDLSSSRKSQHLAHGATYPEKLCDRVISIYSKEGDLVLDPFLGTGTTVISAIKNNRLAVGIELTKKYFKIASEFVDQNRSLFYKTEPTLLNGDCETELLKLNDNSVQLTLTSPPYANLIHKVVEDRQLRHKKSKFVEENNATTKIYSDSSADLGNMEIGKYVEKVERIMRILFKKTKAGGYCVWVVKDFRDTRNKIPYINLHGKIIECGERAGFLHHDLIIWDQNEQRSLVLLGYPSVFYVNQNHSYLVVLRKPK